MDVGRTPKLLMLQVVQVGDVSDNELISAEYGQDGTGMMRSVTSPKVGSPFQHIVLSVCLIDAQHWPQIVSLVVNMA